MIVDEKKDWIQHACKHYGCNEKIARLHFQQFVHKGWNPHPSKKFWDWIDKHPDYHAMRLTETPEREAKVKLWNAERWNAQYREAKEFGLLDKTPKSLL